METVDKMERQNLEAEKGYFLQPLYAQKLDKKIFMYDDLVYDLKNEFKDRLATKRKIIDSARHKCKEMALQDVTLLCEKCQVEVGLLKTVNYISDEMHHAKCVFGFLRRVEVKDALKEELYQDADNKEFVEIQLEMFKEEAEDSQTTPPKFALFTCRNHHMQGVIIDQKFYFTDIS
jgi:hypothetical protein